MRIVAKTLLSIFVFYQSMCIWLLPNALGFLGRYFETALVPYGNLISLNTPWNLFSPDPANTMYFSAVLHFNENHEPPVLETFFPPEKIQLVTDSSARRLLYAMRYLFMDPRRIDVLLAPWLCRSYPLATEVSIRQVINKIPTLDKVLISKDRSIADLRETDEGYAQMYSCANFETSHDPGASR